MFDLLSEDFRMLLVLAGGEDASVYLIPSVAEYSKVCDGHPKLSYGRVFIENILHNLGTAHINDYNRQYAHYCFKDSS